jgi:hypothetical protein
MKCPNKNKKCDLTLKISPNKKNYICSGINKKGTKYKNDVIWLCLKGLLSELKIEMTRGEAAFIISVLGTSLGQIMEE